jgi:hypothetical protein
MTITFQLSYAEYKFLEDQLGDAAPGLEQTTTTTLGFYKTFVLHVGGNRVEFQGPTKLT